MKNQMTFKKTAILTLYLLIFHTVQGQLSESEQKLIEAQSILLYDSSGQQSNWSFLKDVLKDRRIISIGEFTHGAREINFVRNDLIF